MIVTPLTHADYDQWLPLWEANNEGKCPPDVTKETWRRLCNKNEPVWGLAARDDSGKVMGITHYILHPTTGQIAPVCYMQDVFVDPAFRRQGIAREMILTLATMGKDKGFARMYWLAEGKNEAAQNLYKTLGTKLDFSLHVLPLS